MTSEPTRTSAGATVGEAAVRDDGGTPNRRVVLGTLSIKQRITGAQAAAHSQLVRRLRLILPTAAILMLGLFVVNMRSEEVDAAFLDDFKSLDAIPDELQMASPKFAGVDGAGKPFEITADNAIRAADAQGVVDLEAPRAVTQGDDDQTVVTARSGRFQSDDKILTLTDNVKLEHALGAEQYTLRTPAATVLLDQQEVRSTKGVAGQGPGGNTITADEMVAYQNEERVIFKGNVRMKIYETENALDNPLSRRSEKPTLREAQK